jgi:hypothetical protein
VRTVLELKTYSMAALHEAVPDPRFTTTVLPRWINQVYQKIVSHKAWKWNREQMNLTWPATSNANGGSPLYLPPFVDKLLSVYPGSTVGTGSIVIVNASELDNWRPGIGTTLNRDYLVIHGLYGVEADNPATAVVNVQSLSGSGTQNVLLEGMNSNDRQIRETVSVAGGMNTDSTTLFKGGVGGLRRVSLLGNNAGAPVTTTGVIVVTAGSGTGGTTLARIDSAWEREHQQWRTELYATASNSASYTARFTRRHYEVYADQDIIDIPFEFEDLLEYGLDERIAHFRKQPDEVTVARGMWNERLRELRAWDNREPAKKVKMSVRPQFGRRRA